MGSVDREFAAMFSGRIDNSYSFSGIAWIDQYCDYGHGGSRTAGSYSYNAIGSSRTPGNTAIYIGHELGHNMGSVHTHCYSPPVDQCYNAENGCYSGSPQCPVSGKGTIMSYCHVNNENGAGCGSNPEFHGRVQDLLESRLSTELAAGCIAPFEEPDPEPEFSSNPAAGSTLNFGDQEIGTESGDLGIQVTNPGEANLDLYTCGLSGAQSASFRVTSCPSPISPSATGTVSVLCEPTSPGVQNAALTINTNDSDESSVNYGLSCNGVAPPEPEFDSTPPGNSVIDLGNQVIQEVSPPEAIAVNNSGGGVLTLTSCLLSGPDSSWFSVEVCPTSIGAASTEDILISCEPMTLGLKTATLTVHSNDSDESSVSYPLRCSGVLSPEQDAIFDGGFENQQ